VATSRSSKELAVGVNYRGRVPYAVRSTKATPDEVAINEAMPKAHVVFGELALLLGSNRYFAGDLISLADLSIAPQMDMFAGLPEWEALTKAHPKLLTWLATMSPRPSMKTTTWQRVSEIAKAS
jgi:glutathione S-transferase